MFDTKLIKTETNWIEEFEKVDSNYEIFYQEDVTYLPIYSIYIDSNNSIQTIKEEKVFMREKNLLSKEELLRILKRNCFLTESRYTVLSILKYNLNLTPDNIQHFLKIETPWDHLTLVKNIDDIPFDKTISMFQDLNSLIILFYEKSRNTDDRKSVSQTKKIFLNPQSASRKKTLRKAA
jgi:hypothetical protein